ncbi:hypothetical protein [Sporohalobacter salinus]|uniref:hypothetical protein n=1 Tax=Sporohalobacter salinus TaxID=1494606 RepID=UPI00196112DE|nr:hypothetical protein [Sporohalobacter salinus]MBM7622876.1 putative membrane protein YfhO [Sporohalobacter salinus]
MHAFIKLSIITLIIIIVLFQVNIVAGAQRILKGEIVAVNSQQGAFLFKSNGDLKQYQINLHTKLFQNNSQVKLKSLRPITEEDFQPAVIKFNNQGKLVEVRAEYDASPIEIKSINKDEAKLKVKILNSERILNINYHKGINLVRNGKKVKIDQLQSGDQGLIILGLEDRIRKIKVKHYQYKGEF